MHDQYYENNPDYDVLMEETKKFIGLTKECQNEADPEDYTRMEEEVKIAEQFLRIIENLQ